MSHLVPILAVMLLYVKNVDYEHVLQRYFTIVDSDQLSLLIKKHFLLSLVEKHSRRNYIYCVVIASLVPELCSHKKCPAIQFKNRSMRT